MPQGILLYMYLDYSSGFGGKYGVQSADRQDKAALGFDESSKVELHPSQKDMSKGFGGKFGVESDRQDSSAGTFEDMRGVTTSYQRTRVAPSKAGSESLAFKTEHQVKNSLRMLFELKRCTMV